MKTNLTLALVTLTLTATAAVSAQTTAAATSSGLLGQRYAEISGGAFDPHGSSDLSFAGALGANVPLAPGFDLGLGYGYSRVRSEFFSGLFEQRSREHVAAAAVTAYRSYRGVKPFAGAALGYSWAKDKLSFGGAPVLDDRDNAGLWGLNVGVEVPIGTVTLTPKIAYQDDFESGTAGVMSPVTGGTGSAVVISGGGRGGAFTYGTEAHMWFTRSIGGFAEVAYSDPTGGRAQSWTYALGARMRF